jgi:hypothetical protein
MGERPILKRGESGAYSQTDLDALTKSDLLALLGQDPEDGGATREELLGVFISIDWAKFRKPGQEHAVEAHSHETLEGTPGLVFDHPPYLGAAE